MRILVTGASGFLGSEVCRVLRIRGHDVFETSRNASEGVHCQPADIRDEASVKGLLRFERADCIVHCAGLVHQFQKTSRDDFFATIVSGTQNVCDLSPLLKAKNFVLVSSVSVYGKSEHDIVDETTPCNPEGDYAKCKFASEEVAKKICAAAGINLTILRPATIVGEGDRGNVFRLIRTVDRGRFFWIGSGTNLKSLVDKTDVARACAVVAESVTKSFQVYNVSSDAVTMRKLVVVIYDELSRRPTSLHLPTSIAKGIAEVVKGIGARKTSDTLEKWMANDVFSSAKIFRELGFVAEFSSADGLRREIAWYKQLR